MAYIFCFTQKPIMGWDVERVPWLCHLEGNVSTKQGGINLYQSKNKLGWGWWEPQSALSSWIQLRQSSPLLEKAHDYTGGRSAGCKSIIGQSQISRAHALSEGCKLALGNHQNGRRAEILWVRIGVFNVQPSLFFNCVHESLRACLCILCVCAWCWKRPEERIRSFGTGITGGAKL